MPSKKRSFRAPTFVDADNRFPVPTPPPYFTVPAYWRRFVFQVLSSREWSVYTYMCSVANPDGVAFPLRSQIMEDCGLRSKEIVADALARLVEAGFLLHQFRPISPGATVKRHFYQRPSPLYTLFKLLERGEIDGDLYPTKAGATRSPSTTSEGAILNGLANLVGDDDLVQRYADETDPVRRRRLLMGMVAPI